MLRRGIVIAAALLVTGVACSSDGGTGSAARRNPTTVVTPKPSATLAPSGTAGCGHPADAPEVGAKPPGDVVRSIQVDGVERTYRLGVPAGYDPDRATPLVMNLHGSGSNALQASVYGNVTQVASDKGMLSVTPDAIDGKWQLGASGTDHDFLTALVGSMKSRYCVDPDRVFIIGMSLGAWKAAATACAEPSTFAAAALVAVEVHPPECPPLPVVAFHGTDDPVVPYGEGSGKEFPDSPNAYLPGTHENIANWAKGNRCHPEPTVTRIGDDVEHWTFRDCTAGLELYTVIGGAHTWPGSPIELGPTTHTIDATRIAFAWFDAHPRRR